MTHEDEVKDAVELWRQAIVNKDLVTAAALRADTYSAVMPDGKVLSKQQELDALASPEYRVRSMQIENLRITVQGMTATAVFDALLGGDFGTSNEAFITMTITFHNQGDGWCAAMCRMQAGSEAVSETPRPPRSIKGWLFNKTRRFVPSFEELAYIPYKAQSDYVLPASQPRDSEGDDAHLPIPPRELWLRYNYRAGAKGQVGTMLQIVRTSGVEFETGDRILDFGCGAGRMIRHLQPLAGTCEIWGTDISAEHVLWCKRNLQPPFHFATTTKVPHLPFEDRSFRLIYCGSVFTHIDDLADTWLLELRRIMATDGRVYLTFHDEHTIELWEKRREKLPSWLRAVVNSPIYRESKAFDMITVGRGHLSHVFYNRDYFLRTLRSMFEVISVTPEAYFAQTAVLLKRKPSRSS
ncbi:MAG TPA: methyltransferase domain-containing protein [Thermoanaerobaculia bacterium]